MIFLISLQDMSKQETRIVQKIRQVIDEVQVIYLFGSTVSKDVHSKSDIDLAVVAARPIDPVKLWYLAQDLALIVGKDVDLVDLRRASTVFRYQVINSGKRIFCMDPMNCDQLENTWDSMYLRLNEERNQILRDYDRRI